jgi:hypothetical protein
MQVAVAADDASVSKQATRQRLGCAKGGTARGSHLQHLRQRGVPMAQLAATGGHSTVPYSEQPSPSFARSRTAFAPRQLGLSRDPMLLEQMKWASAPLAPAAAAGPAAVPATSRSAHPAQRRVARSRPASAAAASVAPRSTTGLLRIASAPILEKLEPAPTVSPSRSRKSGVYDSAEATAHQRAASLRPLARGHAAMETTSMPPWRVADYPNGPPNTNATQPPPSTPRDIVDDTDASPAARGAGGRGRPKGQAAQARYSEHQACAPRPVSAPLRMSQYDPANEPYLAMLRAKAARGAAGAVSCQVAGGGAGDGP